jgi:hypothetical protein
MKYLKLYEDFNNQDDILEDIKWIMIEVSVDVRLVRHILDGNLVTYQLSNNYNEDDLRVANKRLNDIGYTLFTLNNDNNNVSNTLLNTGCLIVNTKLIDLSKFYDTKKEEYYFYINRDDFYDIKKKLLFKYLEKTPNLVDVNSYTFLLTVSEAYDYLYDFLGNDGVSKNLHEIVDNKYHISDGGYDYDFTLESIEKDGDEFRLKVYIFDDGEVEIIHSGDVMDIIDAITDEEIGWEIKMEMEDSIVAFLHRYIGDADHIITIEIVY